MTCSQLRRRLCVMAGCFWPQYWLPPWVEETIEQTLTFFLPFQHHKHLKSTNMLERLNEEIRRRTYLVLHLSQYRELPRS